MSEIEKLKERVDSLENQMSLLFKVLDSENNDDVYLLPDKYINTCYGGNN